MYPESLIELQKETVLRVLNRLVKTIKKYFMMKKDCSSLFLNVSQGFDEVWQEVFIFKLTLNLPIIVVELLKSYIMPT